MTRTIDQTGPTRESPRMGYLPALDGLRALAVAMVVAYHLDVPWAQGGFLGVDLFFVISGFLITTLLLRERRDDGTIAIGQFWVRRFRRLVPPVVVMVLATIVATRWWGVPEQWRSVRLDATSAIGYVANWRFVLADQSYFDATLGPSPLRHTWSLALEEQWYFVWPVVVAALCWMAARSARRRWLTTLVVFGLAVCSAGLMALLYDAADPSRVYYGTDTRAQHLLIGAALAFVAHRRPALLLSRLATNPWLMNSMLGVFAIASIFVDDETPWLYFGGLFGLSVVGAVVVAGVAVPDGGSALRWLGATPLVWLGRRSYAIYLWHWPVIVFVGEPMGIGLSRVPLAALQVLITLALADVSFRLVESPVRRSRRAPARLVGAWGVGAAASVLIASMVLVSPADRRQPIADVVRPSAPPATVRPQVQTVVPQDPSASQATATGLAPVLGPPAPISAERAAPPGSFDIDLGGMHAAIGTSQAAAAPVVRRLLLVGDSTAVVMSTRLPDDEMWTTDVFARLGCSTTAGSTLDSGSTRALPQAAECGSWRYDWQLSRDIVTPDVVVVMVGAWEVLDHVVDGETHRFGSDGWTTVIRDAIDSAADVATGEGNDVVLLTVPCMQQPAKSDFSAQARNDGDRVDAFNQILDDVASTRDNTSVARLDALLCPDGLPLTGSDGNNIRYDGVHLTPEGVDLTWDWLLEEVDKLHPSLSS